MIKSGMTVHNNSYHDPDFAEESDTIVLGPGTSLEINVSGAITVTGTYHLVDTYEQGASSNLTRIYGGVEGQLLVLTAASTFRTVVVVSANDYLACGSDFTMTSNRDKIMLICDSPDVWHCISTHDNN